MTKKQQANWAPDLQRQLDMINKGVGSNADQARINRIARDAANPSPIEAIPDALPCNFMPPDSPCSGF